MARYGTKPPMKLELLATMYIDYDEDIGIVKTEQIPVYKDYDGQFYQDFEGLDDEEEPIEIINKEEKSGTTEK